MIKLKQSHFWLPDYAAQSIHDIDSDELKRVRITHIVFDLDNTLVPYRSNNLPDETTKSVQSLQKTGFTIMIGSNTRREINFLTEMLEVTSILAKGKSIKPFKSFYKRLIKLAETSPEHMAMVGDHLVNDVIGANRAGFTTILVSAINNKVHPINKLLIHSAMKRANK